MSLSFEVPTPLDYFASLVQGDADFALLEAAICVAHDEYPEVDVQTVLSEVDKLLGRIRKRIPKDAVPVQKLRLLNHFFFQDLGFTSNVNDYYDPDNSFIHMVLQTRRGIPISLAVLWLELAQSLGLSAQGVGFPGHFLVKIDLPMGQAVIDPVDGKSLSREALSERLEPFRQRSGLTDPRETPLALYLHAATPRDIIARLLGNLKEIYRSQRDWARMLVTLERLIVLLPESWNEYRDRGLAHAELGHTEQALADLECYLVHADERLNLDAIADRVDDLRGSMG
jgi:regulator of sirC expression with transglutaminase-like and TPR domain